MYTTKKRIQASHDSAWKEIIDQYLPQLLEFCFPAFYKIIDWSKEWITLDKELQAITKDGQTGKRFVDKLIRMYLKDGQMPWVLIHLEVEQNPSREFTERMLIYNVRSYDKYRQPIFSCAILTDNNKSFRPCFHEVKVHESKLRLDFSLCKLVDFEKDREKLERSPLPFATVILYHLDIITLKKQDIHKRLQTKISLTKRLYEKGFLKEDILNLYRFLDFSIVLPNELELKYKEQIYKIEKEKKMPYLTSIERFSIQKGMQQGMQQGKMEKSREIAKRMILKGMLPELVVELTELTFAEVLAIKANNGK